MRTARHIARRALVLSLATACAAAASAAGATAPASALAVVCQGSSTAGFSPGLTNTTQRTAVDFEIAYEGCTRIGIPIEQFSGSVPVSATVETSCTALTVERPTVRIIRWSDSTTSRWEFAATGVWVTGTALGILQVGEITDGRYRGAAAEGTQTLLGGGIALCDTARGITQLSGLATLSLIG